MRKITGAVLSALLLGLLAAPALAEDGGLLTKEALVGSWETGSSEDEWYYTLDTEGTFSAKRVMLDLSTRRFGGTWSVKDGVLEFTGTGETRSLKIAVQRLDDRHMDLTFGSGDDAIIRRWRRPYEDGETPPQVIGTWSVKAGEADWRFVIAPDFSAEWTRGNKGNERIEGTWFRRAAGLYLRFASAETVFNFHYRPVGEDQLEMTFVSGAGRPFLWKRIGDAPPSVDANPDDTPSAQPTPKADFEKKLLGEWQTGDGLKVFTYGFLPDGTWELKIEIGERIKRDGGTWAYEDDALSLTMRGEDEPLKLGVTWLDSNYVDTWLAENPKMPRIRWVRRIPTAPKEGEISGTWIVKDPSVDWKLDLREGGTYTMTEGSGASAKITRGTWRPAPAAVVMRLDDDPEKEFTWNLRWLDADHLDFTDEHADSGDVPWERAGVAAPSPTPPEPDPQEPAAGAEALVGSWFVGDESMSVSLTLNADKTFLHVLKTKASKETTKGTWKLEGNLLIGDPDDEDVLYRLRWKLLDKNRLELYDEAEKETSVMQREGTQAAPNDLGALSAEAKAMVGEWLARGEGVEIRLSLRSDGTFTQSVKQGKNETKTQGRFNVTDGQLLAMPENETEAVRLKVRLIDANTLEIVDPEGGTTELVRQKG